MSKFTRQNVLLAIAGTCFVLAGLRDLFFPGVLTLNHEPSSKTQIAMAVTAGMIIIGFAAVRSLQGPGGEDGRSN